MLATMRKLSKTWVFKGLMTLLVVSFSIWGIGDMFRGHPEKREVARVGGEKIIVQSLQIEFQKLLSDTRRKYGATDLSPEQAKKMGMMEQALQMMIDRMAMDMETNDQGIYISDEMILKRLGEMEQFRNKDGSFNGALFQQALMRAGLTEKSFMDLERREMSRQMLLNAFSQVEPSKVMIDNIYKARGAKRILEVVSIKNSAMRDVKMPTDDEQKAYYEANTESFIAPEIRGLTVAAMSVPAVEKDIAVSDEDLRKAYDAQKDTLVIPETRDLIQIVVQDQAKADAVAAKAKEMGDLSKAAKAEGLTPIAMNKIDEKTVLPELYATLFGMGEGEISGALKSSLGFHVVEVKKIHEAGKPTFDAVKDELRNSLKAEKVSERVTQILKDWDDAVAAGTPLEEIADTLKLRLTRVAAIDQTGHTPDGKKVDTIPLPEKLIPDAFAQSQGDVSQIIDDGKDNYYVVRTDVVTPSQVRAFADVKDQVKKTMVSLRQAQETAKIGTEIANALRSGQKATSFASRPGVEIRLSKALSLLGDVDKSLPAKAVDQAFKMRRGEVADMADEDSHLVLRLADVVPVDPKRPEQSRVRVVDDLKKGVPYDVVGLFSAYTKQAHAVKINQSVLDALKMQGDETK